MLYSALPVLARTAGWVPAGFVVWAGGWVNGGVSVCATSQEGVAESSGVRPGDYE